jgi:hypothetical protein
MAVRDLGADRGKRLGLLLLVLGMATAVGAVAWAVILTRAECPTYPPCHGENCTYPASSSCLYQFPAFAVVLLFAGFALIIAGPIVFFRARGRERRQPLPPPYV